MIDLSPMREIEVHRDKRLAQPGCCSPNLTAKVRRAVS
jgi:hypothetical protein